MSLRVKLDDFFPNSQPRGLDELDIVVSFSADEKTLLQKTGDTSLTFTGDAYEYLRQSQKENGYNGIHNVEIQKRVDDTAFSKVFTGKLFINDCTFDLDNRFCQVDIEDTGVASFIANNKEIRTNFTTGKTKNGLDIDIVVADIVELINPPSNTVPAVGIFTASTDRRFYPLKDVLNYLTKFVSDDSISFQSDFIDELESSSNGTKWGIIRGKNLRTDGLSTNGEVVDEISFMDVLLDFSRLYDLILTSNNSTGSTVARLEGLEFFRNDTSNITKDNVSDIKQSYIQDLIYGQIDIGSKDAIIDGSAGSLVHLPPFDFGKDIYYISGLGNLDKTLDMQMETFITDSNIIEDIITNDNDTYDNEWFLISYHDVNGTFEAWTEAGNIFGDGNYYYNGEALNKNIVIRYNLHGAAVKTSGSPDGDFVGTKGNTTITDFAGGNPITGRIVVGNFDNVIADPGGLWNTTTNTYTATNSGIVNLRVQVDTNTSAMQSVIAGGAFPITYGNLDYVFVYKIYIRFKKNGVLLLDDNGNPLGKEAETIHMFRTWWITDLPFQIDNTVASYPVFLDALDTLEIEHSIVVGYLLETVLPLTDYGRDGILVKDIPKSAGPLIEIIDNSRVTGGLIDTLSSSSLIISTQGSLNGIPITTGSQKGYYINRFEFPETLDGKEMVEFLNNPQNAITLQNNEHNINSKLWAYNVSINAKTGETSFELINNINSL